MDESDGPLIMIDGELYPPHSSHEGHKLRLHLKPPEPYTCAGCKIPGDLDPCFKCPYDKCPPFYLHKLCYELPQGKTHLNPIIRHCEFKFCNDISTKDDSDHSGGVPYCDACGMDVKGFRFHCIPDPSHPHDNHHLHPTCALADLMMDTNFIGVELELKDKVKSKCLKCGKRYPAEECIRFTGWKWVSKKREHWLFPYCFTGKKICYHLKCMNVKLLQQNETKHRC